MRSLGIVLSSSVQAERHGPSITTRSPLARTAANSLRYPVTSPPGLDRMRAAAETGPRAASKKMVVRITRRTGSLPLIRSASQPSHKSAPVVQRGALGCSRDGNVTGSPGLPGEPRPASPFTIWTLTGATPLEVRCLRLTGRAADAARVTVGFRAATLIAAGPGAGSNA